MKRAALFCLAYPRFEGCLSVFVNFDPSLYLLRSDQSGRGVAIFLRSSGRVDKIASELLLLLSFSAGPNWGRDKLLPRQDRYSLLSPHAGNPYTFAIFRIIERRGCRWAARIDDFGRGTCFEARGVDGAKVV